MPCHSKDRCLEVFLVTCEVDEGDNFGCSGTDLNPIKRSVLWLINHISTAVKTKDIIANGRCSARFNFVLVAEELLTSKSSSIIQTSMSQDTKKSGLSGIYIPYHCDANR